MKLRTPENQNGQSIPVPRLATAQGVRVPFTDTGSASTGPLAAGVYLVSLSAPAFVRVSATGSAGDAAGSFACGAGGVLYLSVADGERVHARGVEGDGSIFVIPLQNA